GARPSARPHRRPGRPALRLTRTPGAFGPSAPIFEGSGFRRTRGWGKRANLPEYNRGMLGEVLTAIVTPFREDGSVDLDRFAALASHLVDNGSDGVVVAGSTGASPTLTDEEGVRELAAA